MRASGWPSVVALAASIAAGCAKPIDLTQALQVQDVSSGWQDAGLQDGKNKLVPSVTFKMKNASAEPLNVLQVNAVFKRVNDDNEWSSQFVPVNGSEGLAPGATSQPVVVNAPLGYTGTDPRQQMLANSQFVDAKVQLFAKYGSANWTRIGEYPITRTLLAR
jgi:hypothetical protein